MKKPKLRISCHFAPPGAEPGTLVKCGKCPDCLSERIDNWSFRLRQESLRATSGKFVTLTYNQENVPLSANGFLTLQRKDLTDFFKRLRKAQAKGVRIKYYAVGEYGTQFDRPHYHAIIFNADENTIQKAWSKQAGVGSTQRVPLGNVKVEPINSNRIGYTVGYCISHRWKPNHNRDDRVPQFSVMSQKLGDNYLTDTMVQWHQEDPANRMYVQDGAYKKSMPRYYKKKLFTPAEIEEAGIQHAAKHADDLRAYADYTNQHEGKLIADYTHHRWEQFYKQRKNRKHGYKHEPGASPLPPRCDQRQSDHLRYLSAIAESYTTPLPGETNNS